MQVIKHGNQDQRKKTKIKEKRQSSKKNDVQATQVASEMKMDQENPLRQINVMTRNQRALRELYIRES